MTSRTMIGFEMRKARSTPARTSGSERTLHRGRGASVVARGPARGRGGSRRAGLTLIELLLVIALLLALAATATPALTNVLAERALESAADVTAQQLMLARAHAQSGGRAIEVAYRPDPPRIIAREFEAGSRGASAADVRAAARRGEDDPFAVEPPTTARERDEDALALSWARRALPAGITLSGTPPGNDDDAAHRLTASPAHRLTETRPIRLAVFASDGSALLGREVWIIGRSDRAKRLEVNPWTGLPRIEEHREREADPGGRETASGERAVGVNREGLR